MLADSLTFLNGVIHVQVVALCKNIEAVLKKDPYMEKETPIRWLLFESALNKAVDKGTRFMTLEQVGICIKQL